MQQLSGLDASFLYMETGPNFGHVGMVALLDPSTASQPLTLERVQALVGSRLHLLPPLRRRLVEVPFGIDRPYWADDPDFDLDFHVRELALPSPGSPHQLAEQVARISGRPLDRSRPLWELYLITGLEGARAALLVKFHHAAIDGVGGAELVSILLDQSAEVPETAAPRTQRPRALPTELEMWWRGVAGLSLQPLRVAEFQRRLLRTLPGSARFLARTGSNAFTQQLSRWARGETGADGGVLGFPGLVAPPTPFNRAITPHRRWVYGTTSLSRVKDVKNAFGVTVNDVVMAACAAALRRWLQDHGALPDTPLLAMVPISVRTEEQRGQFGDRVSALVAALPTHLSEPADRLQAAHEAMRVAKEQHTAISA